MLSAPMGSSNLVLDSPNEGDNAITPEPDSTEDSTGGFDPSDIPILIGGISSKDPTRRMSQPVTGSVKEAVAIDKATNRRASEGSNKYPPKPEDGEERTRMATSVTGVGADWSCDASSFSHIFISTSSSGDACYLGITSNDCKISSGNRLKCVACRVVVHEACINALNSKFTCRPSFCESVRKYREFTVVPHHWVQRKQLKGKCKSCGKTFNSKLGFSGKEIVGISCSWCKYSYHNKNACASACDNDTSCDLGNHAKLIVPPSWIVKVPRKSSFKSSLKNSPNKKKFKKRANAHGHHHHHHHHHTALPDTNGDILEDSTTTSDKNERPFCLKPIPSPGVAPILVFLNPKSGGNQGAKLMQKFQWLLNPRQVFDLTDGGPGPAIEMFRHVPNIKLLACGGDGTVGWLLSVLDKVTIDPPPAVGVLPLGTGNDLSRSLGWGGGYIDEPISKILSSMQSADTLLMDRWELLVERNENKSTEERGRDKLPLNVVNNYFSIGVDAQIALQFHEAREANPQKFNSRIRNKMFYGQAGGKDLLLRKWKDLSDNIKVECDGQDITPKLKEHRVHSVLFANIPSFGSGTRPWNRACGEQRIDDGLIEVIGLTTYQLPLLQAGGHGTCLAQCKSAKIVTSRTIPMQVDGEAIRLNPANIELKFLNQCHILSKTIVNKGKPTGTNHSDDSQLKIGVSRIKMADYEIYHYYKEKIKEVALPFGDIQTSTCTDLDQLRKLIDKIQENNPVHGSNGWCFVDAVTAGRFFRIDRAQENLHYVLDICDGNTLFILDEDYNAEDDEVVTAEALISGVVLNDEEIEEEDLNHTLNDSRKSSNQCASAKKPLTGSKSVPNPTFNAGNNLLEKTTEGVLKAARLGDLQMLSELHHQGYSLLSIDETGKTALHYGSRFGHKEIIRFLIDTAPGSILDMVDNEKGQTALHKAAAYKRRTICCLLIAAGASLLIQDHAGLTPRQLAMMAEDIDLADYLDSQEQFQANKLADSDQQNDLDIETPV